MRYSENTILIAYHKNDGNLKTNSLNKVERITVFSKEKVIVTLLDGINIEVVIE